MGENVKGLTSHDNGRTFNTIKNTIAELGYTLVEPRVLKAIMYQVPQKRERLVLIAIRNDLAGKVCFHWPSPYTRVLTLRDAFYKSAIYDTDVPPSEGAKYPPKKTKSTRIGSTRWRLAQPPGRRGQGIHGWQLAVRGVARQEWHAVYPLTSPH